MKVLRDSVAHLSASDFSDGTTAHAQQIMLALDNILPFVTNGKKAKAKSMLDSTVKPLVPTITSARGADMRQIYTDLIGTL